MHESQERAVADGLRAGDPEAWGQLYDAYCDRVWQFAARLMGGDSADVADVVQETFLAAARSASGYESNRGTLWVWLCGILRNQVSLHFRKTRQQQRVRQAAHGLASLNGQWRRWLDGGEDAPPDVLASSELAEMVRSTLASLPDEYGSLLTSRYLDDITAVDIAGTTNVTPASVRSKLVRARRAFREAFAGLMAGSLKVESGRDDGR